MDLAKIEFLFQLHGYKVYVPERENRCYYYVGIECVYDSSVDILLFNNIVLIICILGL